MNKWAIVCIAYTITLNQALAHARNTLPNSHNTTYYEDYEDMKNARMLDID